MIGPALNVLLVEDNPADARLVTELLREAAPDAVRLTHAARLEQALDFLGREGFSAILLDLSLPDSTGIATFAKARESAPGAPIVVLTGLNDEEMAARAVREGAQDYLVKGLVDGHLLYNSIRYAIERRRAAEALRESEARFRKLAEASYDGIVVIVDGLIKEANEGLGRIFGRAVSELVGRPATDMVGEESRAAVLQRLEERTEGSYEIVGHRPDGRRSILEVTAKNHDIDGRPGRIAALRDVTDQRQLEAQFRQAQKMEAVGRLAGGVAHDFNNLLTVILSYTEVLLEDQGAGSPLRLDLIEIRRAATSAAALTRQLLAFSRQQTLAPRVLSLDAVLKSVEKLLRRVLGEDIRLVVHLASGASTVRADEGQLEQVLMNLAVNARDAMPDGGTLSLETAVVDLDEEYAAEHFPASPGRYVMLAMSDTGSGMSAEVQARIFEPFFTTKGVGKGTGLGLATVYGIVKQSGGFIWVYSEVGRGTTFKIYLPFVSENPDPAQEPNSGASSRGTETILLTEDSASVRAAAKQALERYGYVVLEAPEGETALSISSRHTGKIALLVTDLVMPGASGREVAQRLRQGRPDLRVLYMSGYTDDDVIRRGELEPGAAYLQKPFTPTVLAAKVRQILDGPAPT